MGDTEDEEDELDSGREGGLQGLGNDNDSDLDSDSARGTFDLDVDADVDLSISSHFSAALYSKIGVICSVDLFGAVHLRPRINFLQCFSILYYQIVVVIEHYITFAC